MTMEERLTAHNTALTAIIAAKESRATTNVVKYFKRTFTMDELQTQNDAFWIDAFTNLLNGLFDIAAYQKHSDPNLQTIHDLPQYLTDVYRKKNADYGDSFKISMDNYGLYAPVIRLSDKINRLQQLSDAAYAQEVADERLEDTVLDAINYAQMTLTYLNEKD